MFGMLLTSRMIEGEGHFGETRKRDTQCAVQAVNNMAFSAEKRMVLVEHYMTLLTF